MNSVQTVLAILVVCMYIALPFVAAWGWIRWTRCSRTHSLSSVLSLISFIFATFSIFLAISSFIYAHMIRGFPFYDPLLMRIYAFGTLLSVLGIMFSLGGIWRPSPLRWHAPVCSIGMLFFWFWSAMSE
jgi:hypothetical protein